MPLVEGDLKDKYILAEGIAFRPYIQWYGEEAQPLELQETVRKAQTALSGYPAICWDDYLSRLEWDDYLLRERFKQYGHC